MRVVGRAHFPVARQRRLRVRVREQTVIFPALAAARAFFSFEEGLSAVQAVAADGFAAFVDCVCLGRSSALLGWLLQVLPGLDQLNGPIIALALPVHLAIAAALRRAR